MLAVGEARAALVDLQRQPVVALEDVLCVDPHGVGQLGVQPQPLEVAMERHHVAGLDEVEHQLDLLRVAVPGGVHRCVAGRYDVAADVVEAVDRLVHGALVAGDRRGREDDRVAALQLHLGMVAIGHPAQCRQRLALRAGRDDHDALVGEVVDLARADEQPVGHLDVAQRAADADVLAHRASHQRDLAIERIGRVEDLLNAMDVGGEARHHDAPLTAREDLLQVGAHYRLRRREAVAIHVRGVPAQQQHALAAELGQARDVSRRPVDGRLVELVVPGDQHRAQVGAQGDGAGVGDRVGHVHELQRERPELEGLPRIDLVELDVAQLVLVELRARHRHRQRAAEDRREVAVAELAQDPGQRAQMVLVPVGDHDRLDVLGTFAHVGEVGQHEVDADHLGCGEAQPNVDDDDPPVELDDRHVLADLSQPAERQYTQRWTHAGVLASRP